MRSNSQPHSYLPGFTLIEIILSISILTLLLGLSLPVYSRFQQQSELRIAVTSLTGQLRRAVSLAQSMSLDQAWGVQLESQKSTLFKGTGLGDPVTDELINLPKSVTIAQAQTITFAKLTGYPNDNQSKTVQLNSSTGQSATITVTRFGTIVVAD